MMTAMRLHADLRSALARHDQREAARILLECRGEAQWRDLERYATDLDASVLEPERLARWAQWGNGPVRSLYWSHEDGWRLAVCGVLLATRETLDLQPLQHAWSTTPARYVLPIWEDWAREHAPEHLHAPRGAIEVKEAWCRGEASDAALRSAREGAENAEAIVRLATEGVTRADAWYASKAAVRVASATRWASVDGARDAAYSASFRSAENASWDARPAARAAARAETRDAEYKRWCDMWTAHVIAQVI